MKKSQRLAKEIKELYFWEDTRGYGLHGDNKFDGSYRELSISDEMMRICLHHYAGAIPRLRGGTYLTNDALAISKVDKGLIDFYLILNSHERWNEMRRDFSDKEVNPDRNGGLVLKNKPQGDLVKEYSLPFGRGEIPIQALIKSGFYNVLFRHPDSVPPEMVSESLLRETILHQNMFHHFPIDLWAYTHHYLGSSKKEEHQEGTHVLYPLGVNFVEGIPQSPRIMLMHGHGGDGMYLLCTHEENLTSHKKAIENLRKKRHSGLRKMLNQLKIKKEGGIQKKWMSEYETHSQANESPRFFRIIKYNSN